MPWQKNLRREDKEKDMNWRDLDGQEAKITKEKTEEGKALKSTEKMEKSCSERMLVRR